MLIYWTIVESDKITVTGRPKIAADCISTSSIIVKASTLAWFSLPCKRNRHSKRCPNWPPDAAVNILRLASQLNHIKYIRTLPMPLARDKQKVSLSMYCCCCHTNINLTQTHCHHAREREWLSEANSESNAIYTSSVIFFIFGLSIVIQQSQSKDVHTENFLSIQFRFLLFSSAFNRKLKYPYQVI